MPTPLRGFSVLGFPNLVAKPYCAVTANGPEPADMVGSWLQTEEPSDRARITTLDPLLTVWNFDFRSGVTRTIQGLAVINSNISRTGYWRLMEGHPIISSYNASGIIDSTNLTGVAANISDQLDFPDGLVMGPIDSSLPWSVKLGFLTPSIPPVIGPAKCLFKLRVNLQGSPIGIYPDCKVSLYQGTTLLAYLGSRACADANGQVFIFPWDAVSLPASNGSNIRALVAFNPGDGLSYATLESFHMDIDTSVISTPGHDTGWVLSPISGAEEDELLPVVNMHYFPPTEWTGIIEMSFAIIDDQVDHDPFTSPVYIDSIHTPIAPGFVDLGIAVAGEAMFFSIGETQGSPLTSTIIMEETGSGTTIGGQSFGADLWRRRSISGAQFIVTESEKNQFMQRIAWAKGKSGAFYLAANPDESMEDNMFMSFWATLTECSAVRMTGSPSSGDTGEPLWVLTVSFEEKL